MLRILSSKLDLTPQQPKNLTSLFSLNFFALHSPLSSLHLPPSYILKSLSLSNSFLFSSLFSALNRPSQKSLSITRLSQTNLIFLSSQQLKKTITSDLYLSYGVIPLHHICCPNPKVMFPCICLILLLITFFFTLRCCLQNWLVGFSTQNIKLRI